MEFRLLGPVQIWSGTGPVELKRRQERLLLAVLLLEPGKPVPAERLIELLWPDALPANPRRALQVYVSRLRAVLDVELTSGRDGYAIHAVPGQTDVEQFRSLVEQARRQDDLEQRSKLVVDALALWRGPALADVTTEDVRRRLCRGLDESRQEAEALLRRAAEVLTRRPDEGGEGANAIGWARLELASGRPDEARRTLAEAIAVVGPSTFTRRELSHQQRLLGLV